tara:strand:- start:119 stop:640 length:522 start_codon:yes stop_codon:yes gene_type:complete
MALTRIGLNQSINLASNVTGTLPTANGGTGATSFTKGKVLQVVNATHNTETSSSTNTYVDTGLTASITPSSTSNKVLVNVVVAGVGKDSSNTYQNIKLLRGSTTLAKIDEGAAYTADSGNNRVGAVATTYLDSPSTTSATTYKCQFSSNQNTASVMVQDESSVSTITLMEIEA